MAGYTATPLARSDRFRSEREADWWRLQTIIETVESNSASDLDDEELLRLPILYRSALSALSVARETALDANLIAYLENLCQRAYLILYGARSPLGTWLKDFFRRGWTVAVRGIWLETMMVAGLFLAGALAGYLLASGDDSWFYAFMDAGMAAGRDPTATTEALRATLYGGDSDDSGLEIFAMSLFTHNSRVSILAFALGFALGLPSILVILSNATGLGAFVSVFVAKGLGVGVGGWLAIHGTTEIFGIILSGAAGLHCARGVVFPGDLTRLESAARNGRRAAMVMVGVIVMMLVAGLLEGFGRQLIENDYGRYGIGAAMLLFWLGYFYRRVGNTA
nr:stage II sporulation protein M [Pacificimonas pallii]